MMGLPPKISGLTVIRRNSSSFIVGPSLFPFAHPPPRGRSGKITLWRIPWR
jgi:hypothetical protein